MISGQGASPIRTLLGLVGIGRDPMSQTPEERVLKSYSDRLSAFQVEKSRVVAIEFESEDPELAALVTNTIAEGYLVLQQQAKQEQSRAAGQWLAGEIDVDAFVSHRITLEDVNRGFELMEAQDGIRSVIELT